MNLNMLGIFANMTIEELEKKLLEFSNTLTENESNFFEKGKDFVDAGYQLTSFDSSNKVFEALFAYYFLKAKKR